MFYWVTKNSKFPMNKTRFDKTNPHCSVALSKSNVFFYLLQIKDKFHCQEPIIMHGNFIAKSQLFYMGCLLKREYKQKKNPIFTFKSVPTAHATAHAIFAQFSMNSFSNFEK